MFPGTPAFQLAGDRGQALLESALDQPRWPHHRTAQQKAATLHYSLNKNHAYIDGHNRLSREGSARWVRSRALRRSWSDQRMALWLESLSLDELMAVHSSLVAGDPKRFGDAAERQLRSLREEAGRYITATAGA